MNQVWSPLECNEPDLRLWSLNVIALLHSENEKMMEFGGSIFGRYFDEYTPKYGYRRSDLVSIMYMTLDLIIFIHVWACTHPSTAQTFSGTLARP